MHQEPSIEADAASQTPKGVGWQSQGSDRQLGQHGVYMPHWALQGCRDLFFHGNFLCNIAPTVGEQALVSDSAGTTVSDWSTDVSLV